LQRGGASLDEIRGEAAGSAPRMEDDGRDGGRGAGEEERKELNV
jgi:hypothetical protein